MKKKISRAVTSAVLTASFTVNGIGMTAMAAEGPQLGLDRNVNENEGEDPADNKKKIPHSRECG